MNTVIPTLGPAQFVSPLKLSTLAGDGHGDFVPDVARVRYQVEYGTLNDLPADASFEKAGPRQQMYFDPAQTRAAVVTCGGICPGLNNVIRSIVIELHYHYGVREVLGIRYGYQGLNPATAVAPLHLTPEVVDHIHERGGTILGTSRGAHPPEIMLDYLIAKKVNILFCVGGDGTLRGARAIAEEAMKRKAPVVVVGVPKTIDNDVLYVSRTFGMETAIQRAAEVLECAHTEAKSVFNGIGLVKVMGREAGFIAAGATLASQEVNFCLVPEVPLHLDGPNGFLSYLRERLCARQHALIVVAEGAGQEMMAAGGTDRSGNKKLGDIGLFLKDRLVEFFKNQNMPAEVKYFDPSYYIRSGRTNASDSVLCDRFARDAVHAAMAGKTNMVVGYWNGAFTHVPIPLAVGGKKQVELEGPLWCGVMAATGQPRCYA